jgi:3-oxoacyl-[acyl-carrier protein] reductase
MRLTGKTALVTGGGTGIGRDAAIAFAREGAKVAVMGRRPEPLEETVAIIKAEAGTAIACPGDVTLRADLDTLCRKLDNEWGRLDILLNNAGSAMFKPFMQTSMEDFDYIFRIDLRSVFEMTQVMAPLMKKNNGGSIINISSILGVLGNKDATAYCAMKGGVVNLTRALAHALGPEIRVNCICPSHIITPMMQDEMDRLEKKGKMHKLTGMFPMQRVGYPDDMNGAIMFFASDDSKWLTGDILMVDGGLSCYV